MTKLEEHKHKIEVAKRELLLTKSDKRKKDLKRYITRLNKELKEYYIHQRGLYGKRVC